MDPEDKKVNRDFGICVAISNCQKCCSFGS